jgi:hypothetical protein
MEIIKSLTHIRRLAQWRVQRLIEHFASHQFLCWVAVFAPKSATESSAKPLCLTLKDDSAKNEQTNEEQDFENNT